MQTTLPATCVRSVTGCRVKAAQEAEKGDRCPPRGEFSRISTRLSRAQAALSSSPPRLWFMWRLR